MVAGAILPTTADDTLKVDPKNQAFTFEIVKIAVLSAIGGFLFGYDTGIVSGAMIFIKDDMGLTHNWQEMIVSITLLGAWIFSVVAGSAADAFGRKKVVLAGSVTFTIGSIMMGVAPGKWTLLAGRFVVGAGIGFASMVIPIYLAEVSPAHVRGSLVTMNTLFITGGQAFAGLLAGAFSYLPEHIGWRLMLILAAVPSIVQLVGFLMVPESPRWLLKHNQESEALRVLQKIRGPDSDIGPEFEAMKANFQKELDQNNGEGTIKVLGGVFKDRYLRRALLVGCMLQIIQQVTGINTVMYYSATIIQMSGVYNKSLAVWLAAITALINFLFTFVGVYLVERSGRRLLTLGSLAGVILSLGVLALGFQLGASNSSAIGFASEPLGGRGEFCNSFDSCNSCARSDDCGFCFTELPSGGVNGTCVPVKLGAPATGSEWGSCQNGTMSSDNVVWANDWCPSPYSWMTMAGLCLYLMFFAPGMGPMPWTINAEIYPLWARSACFSTATACNWAFNMLVSATFLTLTRILTKQGAFSLYATFGLGGFIFFYFLLPETKGKSLEDTTRLFGRKSSTTSTQLTERSK